MKTQSTTKILILIIGILLVANIAELALFLTKKETHKDKKTIISEFLQKEIGFNESQMQQYDSLSDEHHKEMKASMEEIRTNKDEEFKQLAGSRFSDSAIHSIAFQSVEKQQALELQLLEYIKEIRKICTPDQQAIFDTSFYKVLSKKNN
jgi:periplasmic protein CpxP/Spy